MGHTKHRFLKLVPEIGTPDALGSMRPGLRYVGATLSVGTPKQLKPVSQGIQELFPQFFGDHQPAVKPDHPVAFTSTRPIPLLVSPLLAAPPGSTGSASGQRLRSQPAASHRSRAVVNFQRPATADIVLRKPRRCRRAWGVLASGFR